MVKTPWKMIFTSLPVWAIIVAHFTENWGWYTLLTQLPTYLKKIMKFSLQEAGVISALPYLAMVIVVQCGGRFGDFLRRRNILETTAVRRIFNSIGFFSQASFLIIVGYTTDKQLAIIGLTLAVGLGGLTWTGFPVNHLDIAPRYASILFGISNCIATFPGMFTPILVGYITTNEDEEGIATIDAYFMSAAGSFIASMVTLKTQEEWRVVFFISAGVYAVGLVFYAIFVSGEKQAWNDENISYEDEDAELKNLLSPSEDDNQLR